MTNDPIRSWAERYNFERGEGPSSRSLAAQRAHLLLAYSRRRQAPRGVPLWAYAAAAATLGAVLLWVGWRMPSAESARFRGEALAVGEQVTTRDSRERVNVPGGSFLDVEARSVARLAALSEKRVEWTVVDGEVAFDVNRKAGASWTVAAGPYRVHVLGTAFVVKYAQEPTSFSVRVLRGTVRVDGPNVGNDIILTAGQHFEATPEPPRPKPAPSTKPSSDESTLTLAEPSASGDAAPEAPRGTTTPSWQTLARSGKYAAALAAVKKTGVDAVLARSSADERILLGNAARFSGDSASAERAYLGARAAGAGPSKSLAAYYLARVALDERRSTGEAVRWLRTFLREDPNGELAASARARLMDLLERSGDRTGARELALEYLRLHPNGPHASLAKSLTREESR